MATAAALVPIEQYLRTNYRPDADFIDGVIEERNLGEFDHARLQLLLSTLIGTREAEWGVIGVVEQRIRVAPSRIRICDIAMLRADAPREKVTQTPPLVCIEVMSPEDRLSRVEIVLRDYLAMGVEHIWFLDPVRRKSYSFDQGGLHEVASLLAVIGTSIAVDPSQLFARLD